MANTYDSRCEDLARVFIKDFEHNEADVRDLAWTIQDAIETYTSGLLPKEKAGA